MSPSNRFGCAVRLPAFLPSVAPLSIRLSSAGSAQRDVAAARSGRAWVDRKARLRYARGRTSASALPLPYNKTHTSPLGSAPGDGVCGPRKLQRGDNNEVSYSYSSRTTNKPCGSKLSAAQSSYQRPTLAVRAPESKGQPPPSLPCMPALGGCLQADNLSRHVKSACIFKPNTVRYARNTFDKKRCVPPRVDSNTGLSKAKKKTRHTKSNRRKKCWAPAPSTIPSPEWWHRQKISCISTVVHQQHTQN